MTRRETSAPGSEAGPGRRDLHAHSTVELLAEIASRFGVEFGSVTFSVHQRVPSGRVVVEHRVHRELAP